MLDSDPKARLAVALGPTPYFREFIGRKPLPLRYHSSARRLLQELYPGLPQAVRGAIANIAVATVRGLKAPTEPDDAAALQWFASNPVGFEHLSWRFFKDHADTVLRGLSLGRIQHARFREEGMFRFADVEEFVSVLGSVDDLLLNRWSAAYLPESRLGLPRETRVQALSRLRPMPWHILAELWLPGEPWPLAGALFGWRVIRYLCAKTMQRLVAMHTLKRAPTGPKEFEHWEQRILAGLPATKQGLKDYYGNASDPSWSLVDVGRLQVSTYLQSDIDTAVERFRMLCVTLNQRYPLRTHEEVQRALEALRPRQLALVERCCECADRTTLSAEDACLPPFHQACGCFHVTWLSGLVRPQKPEAMYDAMLMAQVLHWAIESQVTNRASPPVCDFVDAVVAQRTGLRGPFYPLSLGIDLRPPNGEDWKAPRKLAGERAVRLRGL